MTTRKRLWEAIRNFKKSMSEPDEIDVSLTAPGWENKEAPREEVKKT